MKVYRAGRRGVGGQSRGRILRPVLLILLLLFVLLLVYLFVPFGGQRAVLLGSDARAGEASRSDTIVVTKREAGCSPCRATPSSTSPVSGKTRSTPPSPAE